MKTGYFSEFIKYVSSNVLGMVGLSCYILADTFFISKGLGSDGLAALNLAIPVYSFVHGIGLMFGIGGASKYSVFMGQKRKEKANEIFNNVMRTALVIAIVFSLTGLMESKRIAILLGADGNILSMTDIYLKIILVFAPAFIMNETLIAFVRNDRNPGLAMTAMLSGSIFNIILDYIFIFPLGWGMFGAAFATSLAPFVSMSVLMFHKIKGKKEFFLKKIKISPTIIMESIRIGIPALITEVAAGIVMIIFNMLILGLEGNIGVAAYGIIANLALVFSSVYTGIAQGVQPLISRGYGKNNIVQIKAMYRYALCTMLMVSVLIYTLCFIYAESIAGIFNSEQNRTLQQIAVMGMKLYFTAVPFIGFNVIMAMFFSAMEKALPAQCISILRGIVLMVPMAFVLASVGGMTGIWLTVPITEGIVSVIGMFFLAKWWKQANLFK